MPLAVITGANRGLGFETARALGEQGFRIWLTGRDETATEAAASKLRQARLDVVAATLDVAKPASIRAFAELMAAEPPVDALMNNAGSSIDGFNAEVARRTIDNNYRGAVQLTDALLPRLAPTANIVMVSSGMGELSRFALPIRRRLMAPSLTREEIDAVADEFVSSVAREAHTALGFPSNAYSVSKALLNAFTRVLSRELGARQRVNSVCPGWVKTSMGGSSAPRSLEQGVRGIVWAATLADGGPNGGFFRDGNAIDW